VKVGFVTPFTVPVIPDTAWGCEEPAALGNVVAVTYFNVTYFTYFNSEDRSGPLLQLHNESHMTSALYPQ
jgi:hypothetical protein